MIQLVKMKPTQVLGGDELYLSEALVSSLSQASGGGEFRRQRGDLERRGVAVARGRRAGLECDPDDG